MIEITSYIIILLAYAPGIYCIFKYKKIMQFPLILFTFLGLFIFNASGSILVMNRQYPNFAGSIMTPDYIGIIVVQVLLLYLIAGPYVYLKYKTKQEIIVRNADTKFIFILVPVIVLVLIFYYQEVGKFLIIELINGNINTENVLKYREMTYGLSNFKYYRLGFLVLPLLLAAHVFLLGSARKSFKLWYFIVILMCFIPTLLLAEKSGILYIALTLIIAYSVHLSFHGKSMIDMLNPKLFAGVLAVFIPTIITYHLYYLAAGKKFNISTLIFRIFGVYSESIALCVRYVDHNGHLTGLTLPTIRGVLKHDRFNIETALHVYLSSLYNNFNQATTELKGNIPISSIAEGYVNFGWIGVLLFGGISFLTVLFFQELFLKIHLGIISYSLMVWYAYLALNLSMYSIFYTFFSFIHTYLLIGIILLYLLTLFIIKRFGFEKSTSMIAEN